MTGQYARNLVCVVFIALTGIGWAVDRIFLSLENDRIAQENHVIKEAAIKVADWAAETQATLAKIKSQGWERPSRRTNYLTSGSEYAPELSPPVQASDEDREVLQAIKDEQSRQPPYPSFYSSSRP